MSTQCFLCATNEADPFNNGGRDMPMLPRMTSFFRNTFGKRRSDRELEDEVRGYVDLLAEEKIREGMKPEQARRAARIELGGIEQVKEQVPEARAGAWLGSLFP